MNRDGSLPVHWSRYLRLTVIVSSPEIASSRSTTVAVSRPLSRASEMTASGLPSSGASPKSLPRLDSVGPATLSGPTSGAEDAGDRALAAAGRADQQQDLVQVQPAGDDVAEELLQRGDRARRRRATARRGTSSQRDRLEGVGVVVERHRGLVEEPRVVRQQGARVDVEQPVGAGDDHPGGDVAPSIHAGCWTVSGRKTDRGERVEQVGDLVPVRRPRLERRSRSSSSSRNGVLGERVGVLAHGAVLDLDADVVCQRHQPPRQCRSDRSPASVVYRSRTTQRATSIGGRRGSSRSETPSGCSGWGSSYWFIRANATCRETSVSRRRRSYRQLVRRARRTALLRRTARCPRHG